MSIAIGEAQAQPTNEPKRAEPRPRARPRKRRWPAAFLTFAYAEALRACKPSPYPHVWDEMPGKRSWFGEIVRDVTGLDPQDAEYWIAVLLAMPAPMQEHFFTLRAARMRQAWFVVANADPSQAPEFLLARSLYASERSRAVRHLQLHVPPVLAEASEHG